MLIYGALRVFALTLFPTYRTVHLPLVARRGEPLRSCTLAQAGTSTCASACFFILRHGGTTLPRCRGRPCMLNDASPSCHVLIGASSALFPFCFSRAPLFFEDGRTYALERRGLNVCRAGVSESSTIRVDANASRINDVSSERCLGFRHSFRSWAFSSPLSACCSELRWYRRLDPRLRKLSEERGGGHR